MYICIYIYTYIHTYIGRMAHRAGGGGAEAGERDATSGRGGCLVGSRSLEKYAHIERH